MNISKNSRLPTFFEENTLDDAMVLRSGKKINIASSTTFGYDLRAIADLFAKSPCLKPDCGYGIFSNKHGKMIYGGKKHIVEHHEGLRRTKGRCHWACCYYGRDQPKTPKYMMEIIKQEFCSACLKSDLLLTVVSKYKNIFRFLRRKQLRDIALLKLDEVIAHCNKSEANGYNCSDCETRQQGLKMRIHQGPITRNGDKTGRHIEQAVLASMTTRNNFEILEEAKYLKKYISSPHAEVQTAYFKLGSILPGDCVKSVFSFL